MRFKGRKTGIFTICCLALYYGVAYWLPASNSFFLGKVSKNFRAFLCGHIFLHCGKGVNVERKANFGCGVGVELGDESGLGVGCVVPSDTRIGNYVMMGPNCRILHQNHNFGRTDIPMCHQGLGPKLPTVIEDDVWIGRDVLITPGRVIRKGSIVGCGCVLSKDFPEYSIIGGNPPRLIRSRLHV